MTSDLFHDAARAYYGVSAEVYTLANIATNGNAPASYALGGEADSVPQQYIGELDEGPANPLDATAEQVNSQWDDDAPDHWGDVEIEAHQHATKHLKTMDPKSPFVQASQRAYDASRLAGKLPDPTNSREAGDAFKAHQEALNAHAKAKMLHVMAAKAARTAGPDYGSDTSSVDAWRRHMAIADDHDNHMYDHIGPVESLHEHAFAPKHSGMPYALGDARTTGTGTQLPDPDDDPDSWPVNPMDATDEEVESERDLLRRSADEEKSPTGGKYVKPELPPIAPRPRSSRGQKGLFKDIPIDYSLTGTGGHVTGDEEDYGLMDALGFGKKPPAPRPPAAPVSRAQVQAAASKLTPKPAAAAPSSRSQVQAAADKLRKGLPVIKDVMTDYSLTGTGTKVKVPESKNCAKSGCGMKAK